ncbi:MAG: hypothetical protein DRJ43_00055 [Thermoprotei archaeon]|nr:MAG: hypothetical protein DRJ43_00055 [Thermoprotei archaeon]
MRKILILGLDGLCYEWIFRMNMKFLSSIDTGMIYGIMRSYIPPITPMVWTSILTGVNPELHNIWYFHDEHTLKPICLHYDCKYPCLWHLLENLGIEGAWLWIPLTYPLSRALHNKLFFSGIPIPNNAKPSRIMSIKFYDFVRKYINLYDMKKLYSPHKLEYMSDNIVFRFRVIRALLNKEYPSIFAVIPETDLIWHVTDSISTAHDNVYTIVDEWLQEIVPLAINKGYEVFIVSDHGEADFTRYVVFINNILRRRGLIKFKTSLMNFLINSVIRTKSLNDLISITMNAIPWNLLFEITLPFRSAPKRSLSPREFLSYAMIGSSRYGYIKVKGRGIAQKILSEKVMKVIQEELGDIIENIYLIKELYPNALGREYDIIVKLKRDYLVSIGILPYDIDLLKTRGRYAHSLNGVFMWISKNVQERKYIGTLKPEDITASIVARLGFKPPHYFTGKPKVPFGEISEKLIKVSERLLLVHKVKYLRKKISSKA